MLTSPVLQFIVDMLIGVSLVVHIENLDLTGSKFYAAHASGNAT